MAALLSLPSTQITNHVAVPGTAVLVGSTFATQAKKEATVLEAPTLTPFSHAQLTLVSETGFNPVSTRFALTCTLLIRSDNDIIRKKKMAAEDQVVVVILCFTLVWFWRRRAQQRSAARARDAAARR